MLVLVVTTQTYKKGTNLQVYNRDFRESGAFLSSVDIEDERLPLRLVQESETIYHYYFTEDVAAKLFFVHTVLDHYQKGKESIEASIFYGNLLDGLKEMAVLEDDTLREWFLPVEAGIYELLLHWEGYSGCSELAMDDLRPIYPIEAYKKNLLPFTAAFTVENVLDAFCKKDKEDEEESKQCSV